MAVCLKADRLHIDGQAAEPTDSNIEPGDIYYNTTEDTLYRRDQNNEWVAVGGGAIIISNTEPDVSRGVLDSGKLWFDTGTSGALLVWDGYSWIEILDPAASNRAIASATAPSNPVTGDTWFDLPNNNLYVWNGSWVQLSRSPTAYNELKDMTDVSGATGTAAGKLLQSNGNSTFSFAPGTLDLVQLTDVTNAATATAGQILQTNSNNSTYTFVTPEENLGDLSNVSAAGNNNNSLNKIFARTGNSQFGFITHEHALVDIIDVDVTPAAGIDEYVLTADGDGTYSFQQLTGALATYGPNPPAGPSVGELWFDNDDSDAAGLYVYDGNAWIRSTAQPPADTSVTFTSQTFSTSGTISLTGSGPAWVGMTAGGGGGAANIYVTGNNDGPGDNGGDGGKVFFYLEDVSVLDGGTFTRGLGGAGAALVNRVPNRNGAGQPGTASSLTGTGISVSVSGGGRGTDIQGGGGTAADGTITSSTGITSISLATITSDMQTFWSGFDADDIVDENGDVVVPSYDISLGGNGGVGGYTEVNAGIAGSNYGGAGGGGFLRIIYKPQ